MEEFAYHESWGEQLTDVRHPVACVLDLVTGKVEVVDTAAEHVSVSEAIWAPNDDGIVFVGLKDEPRKLGKLYCFNRRSSVTYYGFNDKKYLELGDREKAVKSPRFNSGGTLLVFAETEPLGAHLKSERLMKCDWKTKRVETVTDVVNYPAGKEAFPGLFSVHLPERCWCNDDRRVVLDSLWGIKTDILVVDVVSRSVTKVTNIGKVEGCWTALGVWDDFVLAAFSSPVQTPTIFVARLPAAGHETDICWVEVDQCGPKIKHDVNYSLPQFQRDPEAGESQLAQLPFEALFTYPTEGSNWPLIVFPHGGPHTATTIAWNLESAFFMSFGYSVLRPNYHGSTGYGENFVNSLPGHIGHTDVLDCLCAMNGVIRKEPRVDRDAVYLFGGSHGGFLVLHLSATGGTTFKACVARNPVANVAAMVDLSDMPDWSVTESQATTIEFESPVSAKMREKMWLQSPVAHADKTVTPTLFMLGATDLRVPHFQSKEYIHVMKARGIPVKVLFYPENCHPLDSVDAECDVAINSLLWFERYKK